MNAKEYLSQAYDLDQRINSKLEQIESLNEMATKYISFLSFTPGGTNKSNSRMEDTVTRIVDMQEELNAEINSLLDLKEEITGVINSVPKKEYRVLLEHRYLCFRTWEEVSIKMHYSSKWVRIMHERALKAVNEILKNKKSST